MPYNVTTVAGLALNTGSTDGIGSAARFNGCVDVCSDGSNLYVTDIYNNTIRKIVISTGVVTTLAGLAGSPGSADGTGNAARFYNPVGICTDGTYLYVCDTQNYTIRQIVIATGVVTTIAGLAGNRGTADGIGSAAHFYQPDLICINGPDLYLTDDTTIRKIIIATADVSTFAGLANTPGNLDGIGNAARFNTPTGICTDGANLYITDYDNLNIRQVVISSTAVTTLASSGIPSPLGISTDGTNLIFADDSDVIFNLVIATGILTTIAGLAGSPGSADGIGSAARFNGCVGVQCYGDNLNTVFVADSGNSIIRQMVFQVPPLPPVVSGLPKKAVANPKQNTVTFTATITPGEFSVKSNDVGEINTVLRKVRDSLSRFKVESRLN